jgi:hypothetical protein
MEAKQSREKGRPKALRIAEQPDLLVPDCNPRGKRSNANRGWVRRSRTFAASGQERSAAPTVVSC